MVSFQPFADTADAVSAATATMEGKVSKSLQKFLKKKLKKAADSSLAVADKALGLSLKESGMEGMQIVNDSKTAELFRGIRCYMDELMDSDSNGVSAEDLRAMQLGLSHSLSRYKLKFSADKVDTSKYIASTVYYSRECDMNTTLTL